MFVLMLVRIGCSNARKKARSFVATLKYCREEFSKADKRILGLRTTILKASAISMRSRDALTRPRALMDCSLVSS